MRRQPIAMHRRSPPWASVEAFVTAARNSSFRAAAQELGLSAAAFTRRVQALEDHLGLRLFDRGAGGPALTDAGRDYLQRLQPGYDAIRAATEAMAPQPQRPLRLGVSHSLASTWLLPVLAGFGRAHPHQPLTVHAHRDPLDLEGGRTDLGLVWGQGGWPGLMSRPLLAVQAQPVCSPALAAELDAGRRLQDVPLLDLTHGEGLWPLWHRHGGSQGGAWPVTAGRRPGLLFDTQLLMLEAAAAGLGMAVGVRPIVDGFLDGGRLRAVSGTQPRRLPGSYHLVARAAHYRGSSGMRSLWQWLARQARSEGRGEGHQAAP